MSEVRAQHTFYYLTVVESKDPERRPNDFSGRQKVGLSVQELLGSTRESLENGGNELTDHMFRGPENVRIFETVPVI